jgi:hypothetical protein
MSSAAQIDANRANAQLSTGPRSVEGKAASSRNALKLGIHARSLIIAGEDPEALAQLSASYYREFNPSSEIEAELVEVIIRSTWLGRRLAIIEAQIINFRMAAMEPSGFPLGEMFIQDCEGSRPLDKIFRRQQALRRDFFRALAELRRLQERRIEESAPAVSASPSAGSDRVRFDEPTVSPRDTAGPAPEKAPRDTGDDPALRL